MPQHSKAFAVAGIVLAAGASRRMGHNKMLVRLEGESILHRAARRAIAAGLSPVVVVLGHDMEKALPELGDLECEFAFNPDFTGPTSGSLHTALRCLPSQTEAAAVMLADMVFVSSEMMRALVTRALEVDACLVASRYGRVTAPPLLFRRDLFPELLAWTGAGCGKAVVDRHSERAEFLDWPEVLLSDVDTPEDLRRVTAMQPIPTSYRPLRVRA
jgi:molybdenum cofactor cytidylyltransferase